MVKLKHETTFTIVMSCRSIHLIFTQEEHAAMHSKLKDSAPEHPHSVANHPIQRDPTDCDSDIVGHLSAGVALDAALLNLLPDGVEGIHCVVKNNMNQTFAHEINGRDVVCVGEGRWPAQGMILLKSKSICLSAQIWSS